jgi:glycosyltransferase involved in cell wall biosynthesis
MNGHLTDQQLIDYQFDLTSETDSTTARTHLEQCDTCRRRLHELARRLSALDLIRDDVKASQTLLSETIRSAKRAGRWRTLFVRKLPWTGAIAAAVVVGIALLSVPDRGRKDAPAFSPTEQVFSDTTAAKGLAEDVPMAAMASAPADRDTAEGLRGEGVPPLRPAGILPADKRQGQDALATAPVLRPAVVHTLHGLSFHPYQNPWANRLYIAVEKAAARRTDYFISVADAMTEQNQAEGIGVDKPYVTAYSAIEEEQFLTSIPQDKLREFRRTHDIPENAVVLVTIARLFELKGHDYIIESARELSRRFDDVVWLFVGDGNLADDYKEQIRNLGLTDRFRFTGLVPPDRIPLAIQASDILVHCSLREGLARTLPQAMLCGRPAISFDVDGAREVVNPDTGRLVEPKNVPQLIEACAELIQDKAFRERLGQTGRASVKTKFAPDTMVDTIEAVYNKLIS